VLRKIDFQFLKFCWLIRLRHSCMEIS